MVAGPFCVVPSSGVRAIPMLVSLETSCPRVVVLIARQLSTNGLQCGGHVGHRALIKHN